MNTGRPGDHDEDELLERLYDVALDPANYGDLVDAWEKLTAPERRRSDKVAPIDLGNRNFQAHFRRLADLLDRSALTQAQRPEQVELSAFRRSAAFCIDGNLRITAVNQASIQLFGLRPGGGLSTLPVIPEDRPLLLKGIMALFRNPARRSGLLRARSSDSGDDGLGHIILFQLRIVQPQTGSPFVIAVSSELNWPDHLNETLKRNFGLTEAEIDVLRGLAESHSPKQIADQRGRSVQTVRAQIKSLQQKTESRGQGDLLRFALSVMDISDAGDAGSSQGLAHDVVSGGRGIHEARPFHKLARRDGRVMEYLTLGASRGRVVIFMPGMFGVCRWMPDAERYAEREGLRIVVPVRPGYGRSTPLKLGEPRPQAVVGDIAALLDHLGVKSAPMLTLDDDFRYAAAFGAAHPDRLTSILACAATPPLKRHAHFDRMGKWHRFIHSSARYTPSLLPFMIRAGFAMARRLGKDGFVETIYNASPPDRNLARMPEVMETLSVGSEITLSDTVNAADAFAAELLWERTWDWEKELVQLQGKMPVVAIHGRDDLHVPPATQAEMRRDYPWITYHEFPDSGQLFFFSHWRETLAILKELMKNRVSA